MYLNLLRKKKILLSVTIQCELGIIDWGSITGFQKNTISTIINYSVEIIDPGFCSWNKPDSPEENLIDNFKI